MMDLDHFKRFNDTFGHQAGDTLLRTLGDFLKRNTRGQDIACRYGGEEFALVLTDTTLAGAVQRCEILRQQMKQLSVEYAGQLLGAVNISMGVALFPDHGSTITEVLRASDQALYRAKREGRDRVFAFSAPSGRLRAASVSVRSTPKRISSPQNIPRHGGCLSSSCAISSRLIFCMQERNING